MVQSMNASSIQSHPDREELARLASPWNLHLLSSGPDENVGPRLLDLAKSATDGHSPADVRRFFVEISKDEFLATLGHELRSPLAPIRNATQILRLKGSADPELRELAEMVERQVQQLTRLVDDLLDVSRVGHGKINLQLKPIDLNVVVALAVEVSRPLIDARKHLLKVSLSAQPVEVEGDAGRLAQVVSNLLNNSASLRKIGA